MKIPLLALAVLIWLHPCFAQCQANPKAAMREAEANSIILPEFKVQGEPLRNALSTLRNLSTEADPNGRGVDLILKTNSEASINPPISLEMNNVSVAEVLRTIAGQLDLKVVFEPYGVLLTPRK